MSRLLERLKTDILVADGAMGTLLYADGLEACHEYYNISHPEKIISIHRAYIAAGADVIQTNTYAAKRHRLKGFGYDHKVEEINREAVALARQAAGDDLFVLGTIGASRGLKQCDLTLDEIVSETVEQAKILLETRQIDGLLLETYYDLDELIAALKALRPLTDLPIITNMALYEAGITESGRPLVEAFSHLVMLGADIVGLNCHLGPYHMIQSFKQVPLFAQSYLSAYPNASLLSFSNDDEKGHYSFSQNADYFERCAKLFVEEGVRLIGGCCGTTPDHIKALKRGIRGLKPIEKKVTLPPADPEEPIFETEKKESLVDKVKREVTIIAEIDPPKTLAIDKFVEGVKALDKKEIAAITLADNSLARTRICNLSMASLMKEEVETPFLLHIACRDHNMIGLQSRLLGMDILGFDHVLAITGDPSKIGDFPGATSVYDATSFKLLNLIKQLNQGKGYSGASLKKATHFTVAAAFNPNVKNLSRTSRLIDKKVAAGADYFITQPVFNAKTIVGLKEVTQNYEQPFFIGIMPITSYNNAVFLHNEVPGIELSEEFLARLEKVKDDKEICQELALAESKRLIDSALESFNGIYLITPFMRYDLTADLIDYIHEKSMTIQEKRA
ncbi:bifunctional homocysteine S-methyltransferase/methylenetetrahydrofolate reductase [Streptococcus macacae]|uniref:Bifunctional homocysteine S-methyltransferase/5,10-methylenetetrahydrofolate reductase protein n=1 Tax=Streptococcus macacae NCTC 11558 TaxID=764298 RepID=G5JTZ7_9STRE|nr:bifunctional homocysteine S-methyltransferase/methylenetetrahydrofolate reductase [Streptococcus macacae]EHJ52454.1 bifunctional homocysteine S-methyltransferase/5,10-methylenetetrahydrofolate reductase protein [Streptococcus macacae NCTC 11558]SUN78365.1 bifunctional homocysteine S-methyltransferase/5,10-methylenetetrahydrofolate reductase [Streptococcus macacae NCTC 11558]